LVVLKSGLPINKQGKAVKTGTVKCLFDEKDYSRRREKLSKKEEKERRRSPVALLAADNAVTLARYADAETNAADLYNQADVSLKKVTDAWKNKSKSKEIEMLANQTIQLAVSAEVKSIEIQETEIDALKKTRVTNEISRLKESLAAETAKTSLLTDDLKKIKEVKENLQRDFDARFSQNRRLESENNDLTNEVIKLKVEIERLRTELTKAQGKISFTQDLPILEKYLKVFGMTRKEEKGLILNLEEEIWLNQQSEELTPEQSIKLVPLCRKVGETKYLQITIFSSTDAGADAAAAQSLIDGRARRLAELFAKFGVEKERIHTQALLQSETKKVSKTKLRSVNTNKVEISLTLVD